MTTTRGSIETRMLKVPGATLHVEVLGTGPLLLCISGGPTDAGMFTDLAGRLADRYTVVSYDQRGHSRSALESEPEDIAVALHADDAAAILAAVGNEPAYVYGNSGGAPTRIVSAAGEASGEQAGRRAAIALAERLGVAVTYLPGGHGGWGSDPQEFAERLHEVLRAA